MNKRTARAILSAVRAIHRAETILNREIDKLEDLGASNVSDDMGWTSSHLSQAWMEGLEHHLEDAEAAIAEGRDVIS
jgi:fido (protein-threonine AMPylation protein)